MQIGFTPTKPVEEKKVKLLMTVPELLDLPADQVSFDIGDISYNLDLIALRKDNEF